MLAPSLLVVACFVALDVVCELARGDTPGDRLQALCFFVPPDANSFNLAIDSRT